MSKYTKLLKLLENHILEEKETEAQIENSGRIAISSV